ncbi:MAG TPA: thioredoxin-dependent thiol peroxidase [Prolixibacteraceae bacterium]|jgi:peroxiredoxin Q/BCP|nr:thioredoxin-dependent thiol peroxidase [Bacteroidales bacterium]HNQ37417.1 thioredoxin-dependent thiol peroxidase [Prolixibacteraceae bacterium]
MTTLKKGDPAPHFEGVDQDGKTVKLTDFKGKKLILYFYPKDNTPGCTAEACNLNDHYETWLNRGYQVVGVSPDSAASHQKFIAKYGLKFTLLSDPEHRMMELYGAWGEKKMYGKPYMGVLRTTFVIDGEGMITEIFTSVDTKNHTFQIEKTLNL